MIIYTYVIPNEPDVSKVEYSAIYNIYYNKLKNFINNLSMKLY